MFIIKNVSLPQVDESGEKKWTKWFSTMHPTKSDNSDMTVMHARAQAVVNTTRPDTRLPKSRAGGQGPYLRSPDHLGRSSEVREVKS